MRVGEQVGWVAIAVFAALVVGIFVADRLGSGSTPGVAYVTGTAISAAAVWLANADGSHARVLGRGSQPLLAPNGSLLAASSASGLILYPASGGAPHRYVGNGAATAFAMAFSPDSRYLAAVLSSTDPVWGRGGIAFDRERLRAHAEPAYQVWLMASDGSAPRSLTALSIPPLREGLVPTAFSDEGGQLLAESEGQDTSAAWLLSLSSGRATPLGADLVGAALSRDDRDGFLNPPGRGVVESLPLAGRPRVLAADGSEPSWNA